MPRRQQQRWRHDTGGGGVTSPLLALAHPLFADGTFIGEGTLARCAARSTALLQACPLPLFALPVAQPLFAGGNDYRRRYAYIVGPHGPFESAVVLFFLVLSLTQQP